jgi:hypothetical protein
MGTLVEGDEAGGGIEGGSGGADKGGGAEGGTEGGGGRFFLTGARVLCWGLLILCSGYYSYRLT